MPVEPPRALVVLVHGVTEHCGRYHGVAERFVSIRTGVCGFDLRGHGRSAGHRGHVAHWQDYISDLVHFLEQVREAYHDLPVFLFGHSLGSLIVLRYVMEHPNVVRGAIVCGAAIQPIGVARPHLVALARAFSSFWPTFAIPLPIRKKAVLSRDPKVESDFLLDPLVNKTITARFGVEGLALVAAVRRQAHAVEVPLLIIHGGADSLNALAGAQELYDQVSSPDKRIIVYPGGYHEPHHDLDRDQVLADLCDWIKMHW